MALIFFKNIYLQYVGSVVVEKSINSLSPEKQAQLARFDEWVEEDRTQNDSIGNKKLNDFECFVFRSCMRLVTDKQSHQAEDSNHDDALRTVCFCLKMEI